MAIFVRLSLSATFCIAATSSCTRATAAGQTRIISACALAGSLAIGVCHAPVSMRRIAQELGAFGAQLDDFADGFIGVVGIAVVAAIDELAPHLLAQIATASRR